MALLDCRQSHPRVRSFSSSLFLPPSPPRRSSLLLSLVVVVSPPGVLVFPSSSFSLFLPHPLSRRFSPSAPPLRRVLSSSSLFVSFPHALLLPLRVIPPPPPSPRRCIPPVLSKASLDSPLVAEPHCAGWWSPFASGFATAASCWPCSSSFTTTAFGVWVVDAAGRYCSRGLAIAVEGLDGPATVGALSGWWVWSIAWCGRLSIPHPTREGKIVRGRSYVSSMYAGVG